MNERPRGCLACEWGVVILMGAAGVASAAGRASAADAERPFAVGATASKGPSAAEHGATAEPAGGRIRLYWDYHGRDDGDRPPTAEATHPELEGVILGVPWADVELKRGVFDFSAVDAQIQWWADRGKKVMIRNGVLGTVVAGAHTPNWVYAEGVRGLEFQAKPRDRRTTKLPLVWDSPLFLTLYDEYVAALAKHYDGDPRVSYIWMGVGHLGLTTADATAGGDSALPAAGWTADKWEAYIAKVVDIYTQHFAKTPTVLASGALWTRDARGDKIVAPMQRLGAYAASKGASLLLKGLDPDPALYAATPFSEMLDTLGNMPLPHGFTLFMGDDWPMWVNQGRRSRNRHEAGRDEAGFAKDLETALHEWDRLGRKCDLVIVMLKPEIQATNPHLPEYQPQVRALWQKFLAQAPNTGP
jgi:hypothetical protein